MSHIVLMLYFTRYQWKRVIALLGVLIALATWFLLAAVAPAVPLLAQDVPTPTPTPDRRVVNEIIVPQASDAIAGFLTIQGTALIEGFRRYDIHISEAGNEDWMWVTSSTNIIRSGILYQLDTTQYTDGFYDLRIRAVNGDGNYTEAFVLGFEIRNANPPTSTPIFNEAGTPVATAHTDRSVNQHTNAGVH